MSTTHTTIRHSYLATGRTSRLRDLADRLGAWWASARANRRGLDPGDAIDASRTRITRLATLAGQR